ncbi:uncharacterized protein LOC143343414 [Colletes latitarsis]|uniref:uncharacterized protein LOC143343414 n=1 Tax=Colletes latitarsis TaxID=2605962 RepID=UPI00403539FF
MNERRVGESKWIDCHFRKLIPLYRKSPCLWKRDSRHYLDNERRYRAYRYIRESLAIPGVSLVEILLRIREMRRLYVLELKKLLEAESSGDHRENTYPWFYDLHRFLYPYLDYEEAVELHDVGQTICELEETDGEDGRRNPFDRRCLDGSIKCFSLTRRAFGALGSTSSPTVSMPEVDTHPRTCPRSCSRIIRPTKQLDDELSHKKHHEFVIYGLHSASSNSDSFETDSDNYDAFSMTVTRLLRKLDRPFAIKAQRKIQKILSIFLAESNVTIRNFR